MCEIVCDSAIVWQCEMVSMLVCMMCVFVRVYVSRWAIVLASEQHRQRICLSLSTLPGGHRPPVMPSVGALVCERLRQKNPASQSPAGSRSPCLSQNLPGEHGKQSPLCFRPVLLLNVPKGHSENSSTPVPQKAPAGQVTGSTVPLPGQYDPDVHLAQAESLSAPSKAR